MRCLLRTVHTTCHKHAIKGWRKSRDWNRRVRRFFNRVRTSRQRRKRTRVQEYLSLCRFLVEKVACTQQVLKACGIENEQIPYYLRHARRQIDQVDRRLIKGVVIPHDEKIFSIHEEHTRWITKGKAGVIAELRVPVCVLEDQYGFVLHHHIQWEGGDQDMIVQFLTEAKERYPLLNSCSTDKGFYTPENRNKLDWLLDLNLMPKKGRRNKEDLERETAEAFVEGRRQHAAIESGINNLQHRGLDLVRTHGPDGFARTVALVVVATNVHRLGLILKKQDERRRRWHKARDRAA